MRRTVHDRRSEPRARHLATACIAALVLLGLAAPARSAKPPVGRTYYTVLLGLAAPYETSASCFEFGEKSVCSTDGTSCGSWMRADARGRRGGFTFEMSLLEQEDPVRIQGEGRVDALGQKSSIGGTARVSGAGPTFNYSFAGREVPRDRCFALLHGDPAGGGDGTIVVGSGTVASESRLVSGFSRVAFEGVGRLEILHGQTETLVVSADDNLLPHISSEVQDGTLFLRKAPGVEFLTDNDIVYRLTVTELAGLTLSGVTVAYVDGVDSDVLDVDVSGVSLVEIRGHAALQRTRIAGVVIYDATDLRSQRVDIDISGVSSAIVRASDDLRGRVEGLSTLEYLGNPTVSLTVAPGCTVRRLG